MIWLLRVLLRRLTRGDGARKNAGESVAADERARYRRESDAENTTSRERW